MKKLDTNTLLKPMSFIGGAISEWRLLQQLEGHITPSMLPMDTRVGFLKSIEFLKDAATNLSMHTSIGVIGMGWEDALEQLAVNRPLSAHELQRLVSYGEQVTTTFIAESGSIALIALNAGHSACFDPPTPLFGEEVDDAFPSAAVEISDAGKCRAAGLWTACVMHLMRALEPALTALARSMDVVPDQNWNSALNQIEGKLREIRKSNGGAEGEQWASEAVLQLRAVKNAWRNHAMHARVRYNEEEAIRIFDSVKYLMQVLAARLFE
jgi:hypothetical protein